MSGVGWDLIGPIRTEVRSPRRFGRLSDIADVRVGIVSYEVADELAGCLAALPAALGDLDAEVVVVDNASGDGSAAVAADAGATVVRNPRNVGYARAMNQALAGADAPALIALNPDTVPAPGSLVRLVSALDARPRVAVVAPQLTDPEGAPVQTAHPFPTLGLLALVNLLPVSLLPPRTRARLRLPGDAGATRPGPVDWAVGAVHCIRAAALDGARPYRERWFMYAEDLDLCWRLHQEGWEVHLAPDARVVHEGAASAGPAFGPARRARWLAASYDWHREVHGAWAARTLAVLNLVGEVRAVLAALLRARRPHPSTRPALRTHVRMLLTGRP